VSPEPPTPESPSAVARLFGVMLMVVGILFMSLGGLCGAGTLVFTAIAMTDPGGGLNALKEAVSVLVYGAAVPIAIGYGVFALGRRLNPRPKPAGKPLTLDGPPPPD
jgi:hypothetical protein